MFLDKGIYNVQRYVVMGRQSSTSSLKQRKKVVDVHCSEPAAADPKPGDILRKKTVPGKTRVQILLWVLLACWAAAAALRYKKLVAKTKATYQEGTCSSTCSARPPSIRSTDIVSNSSKASVVLGRQPVSAERGQWLHQRPALAPSLGPYPWPHFYTLPDNSYAPPAFAELHSDIRPNPYIVIAYFNDFWGKHWPDQQRKCPIPCFVSSDTEKWEARADVLVFHAPTLNLDHFDAMIPAKPPNQLWALHSMESVAYYPFTSDSSFMQYIDIQVGAGSGVAVDQAHGSRSNMQQLQVWHHPLPLIKNHVYENSARCLTACCTWFPMGAVSRHCMQNGQTHLSCIARSTSWPQSAGACSRHMQYLRDAGPSVTLCSCVGAWLRWVCSPATCFAAGAVCLLGFRISRTVPCCNCCYPAPAAV